MALITHNLFGEVNDKVQSTNTKKETSGLMWWSARYDSTMPGKNKEEKRKI